MLAVKKNSMTIKLPLNRQIYSKYELGPAMHMTHISNIEPIFQSGALLAKNTAGLNTAEDLSLVDIQTVRAQKTVPCSGRLLHDYVPLYFGNRTPMVAKYRDRNEEIVFLRFSLDLLEMGGVVISDGNARSNPTKFRNYTRLDDLDFLDPSAIKTTYYWDDDEIKRKKQAEILVPDRLPLDRLYEIICYSEAVKNHILEKADENGIEIRVLVRPGRAWYIPPRTQSGAETE
jgi:hypothetical protein